MDINHTGNAQFFSTFISILKRYQFTVQRYAQISGYAINTEAIATIGCKLQLYRSIRYFFIAPQFFSDFQFTDTLIQYHNPFPCIRKSQLRRSADHSLAVNTSQCCELDLKITRQSCPYEGNSNILCIQHIGCPANDLPRCNTHINLANIEFVCIGMLLAREDFSYDNFLGNCIGFNAIDFQSNRIESFIKCLIRDTIQIYKFT